MRNPYSVLGVSKDASQDDIKKAYRKLVKAYHPDRNPGDAATEQKFKDVSAAYAIVGDPAKRKKFDRGEIDAEGRDRPEWQFHRAYEQAGAGRGRGGAGFGAGGAGGPGGGFGGFSADFFEDLFAGRARAGGAGGPGAGAGAAGFKARGTDVAYQMEVDFLEAANGAKKPLVLSSGRSVTVTVPPGTESGTTLRLKGQGLAGMGGGPAGDALVEVTVRPHRHFTRKGRDIHLDLPVTLTEAVKGATVPVPTLKGKVSLKIPAGSNTGTKLRLRGRGLPEGAGAPAGDQYVHLQVHLPDPPDPELQKFLETWKPKADDPRKKAGLT
jgi:DnaJ-class molecular chaperone